MVLREENDVFGDSDRYYTQGLDLSYGYLKVRKNGTAVKRSFGFRNLMYTPTDISIADPQPEDRPWAGLTGIFFEEWDKDDDFVRTEWIVGVVGEWSQSDHIQAWFHEQIDSQRPMGWSNQIPNEPFVNLTMEYYKPLWFIGQPNRGWLLDLTGKYGGTLGTGFVHGEAGLLARAGWNVPEDYRSALIKPTNVKTGLSAYLFVGAEGRYILHNVTLGGSLFQDGPSQELEPFVGDIQTGVAFGYRNMPGQFDLGLAYSLVNRSREFEGQDRHVRFGSVSISAVKSF